MTDAPSDAASSSADSAASAPASSLPSADRIVSLDLLRGVALLGILVMNIQSFSMFEWAYFNPTAYGDLSGANWWVFYLSRLFFDAKFMTMFSMMFGASMLLILDRARARGARPFVVHARRNLTLLLIGAAHGYLLWVGDILFPYALCSFFVFLFRNRSARSQLVWGLLMLVSGTAILFAGGHQPVSDQVVEIQRAFNPTAEIVQKQLDIQRSGWLEQTRARVPANVSMHLTVIPFYYFWRITGMMLIGMALFRWGVLSALRSRRFYWTSIACAVLVGLPLVHMSVVHARAHDWEYLQTFFLAGLYNYWGSLFLALGWIGAVMLVVKSGWAPRLSAVSAVGRMALSNYLGQTLICSTLFFGHGFGLFGRLERVEQIGVVVAVWVLQLIVSPVWLRRYRFGPAEWVWRWATYGQRPAMRVS